jgi:hypothetical protein
MTDPQPPREDYTELALRLVEAGFCAPYGGLFNRAQLAGILSSALRTLAPPDGPELLLTYDIRRISDELDKLT